MHERRWQLAGLMSGGEQQMLAIGRALMTEPQVLVLDEPSMGLATAIVQLVFEVIDRLHRDGQSILLVKQDTEITLSRCDYAYMSWRFRLGDIVVHRIGEMLSPGFDPAFLFPDFDPTVFDDDPQLRGPNFWDAATGKLMSSMQSWMFRLGAEIVLIDTGCGNDKIRTEPAFAASHSRPCGSGGPRGGTTSSPPSVLPTAPGSSSPYRSQGAVTATTIAAVIASRQ